MAFVFSGDDVKQQWQNNHYVSILHFHFLLNQQTILSIPSHGIFFLDMQGSPQQAEIYFFPPNKQCSKD